MQLTRGLWVATGLWILAPVLLSPAIAKAAEKTFAVTSGSWTSAASWSPEGVPGAADTAVIPGGTTAQLNSAASIAGLALDGTLSGTGTLTVTGPTILGSGAMAGSGITNCQGGLDIAGFVTLTGRTLNNAGMAVMRDFAFVSPSNNAVINNLAGGVWEVENDAQIAAGGTFSNAGTFRRTISIGEATISSTFNNTGTVQVNAGTLSLAGGGSGSGVFQAAGGVLQINGSAYTMSAASSASGHLSVASGTLNVAGTYAATTTTISFGTLNITSVGGGTTGTLNQSGGTLSGTTQLTVTGTFAWSAGTQIGNASTRTEGGLEITGFVTLTGRTLNNTGLAVMRDFAFISPSINAVINNLAGGIWEVENDAQIAAGATFNNAGTFRRTISVGEATISSTFNNAGTVQVNAGTLSLAGGGSGSGVFQTAGGVLQINGGTYNMSAPSSASGHLSVASGTLNVAGTYAATTTTISFGMLNITSVGGGTTETMNQSGGTLGGTTQLTVTGPFAWSGGTHTGNASTRSQGGLEITGFVSLSGRTLNNAGMAVMRDFGSVFADNNAVLNNLAGAVFEIENDAQIASGAVVNNGGTWRRSFSSGVATVSSPFNNNGTVEMLSGTLSFGAAYVQTAGSTRLLGGRIASTTMQGLSIQGGTLVGTGVVEGNVVSAGQIAPGLSPGDIEINGTYSQLGAGKLAIEIGGAAAGTQFDRLRSEGAASLGGTLTVSLINNFNPNMGDRFEIMRFGSRSGDFSDKSSLRLGGGFGFNEIITPTALTLEYAREVCSDGLDNDGNGQLDCFDFKCFGVAPCMGTPTNTPRLTPSATPSPSATASSTPSFTATPSLTPAATSTSTVPQSPVPSSIASPSPTRTPTATPPLAEPCFGDCSNDLFVTIDELVLAVAIANGSATPSSCRAFSADGIESIMDAIGNALAGCSGAPTPTVVPTPTLGTGGETAIRSTAGATTVVTNTLGLVPSIVAGLINGIQFGTSSAFLAIVEGDVPKVAGGVEGCPSGGSATTSGSFPFVSITFNNCRVETADGTVTYTGSGSIQLTSFNLNVTAVFRDLEAIETLQALAVFSGTISPTLGGSCLLTAADLTVSNGSLRAITPEGSEVSVTFQGTRIRISDVTFGEDCVPSVYRLTFDGPATLGATGGDPTPVNFIGLRMDVDDRQSGTIFELSGNIASTCFGNTASFATVTALRVTRNDLCPNTGILTVTLQGEMSRILYGADGSVSIDRNGDGSFDDILPNCLDPRLLVCGTE